MRGRVQELAGHTVTRSRGNLAYGKLRRYLRDGRHIEIEVSHERPVSLSFLDELVWRLSEAGSLAAVTFVVDDRDALRKLARVAAIRDVDISYQDPKTHAKRTVKRQAAYRQTVGSGKAKPLRGLSLGSPSDRR